jgi:hypothetical protein
MVLPFNFESAFEQQAAIASMETIAGAGRSSGRMPEPSAKLTAIARPCDLYRSSDKKIFQLDFFAYRGQQLPIGRYGKFGASPSFLGTRVILRGLFFGTEAEQAA